MQDQIKYRDMQKQLVKCEQELSAANQRQDEVDVASLQRGLQRARKQQSDLVDKVKDEHVRACLNCVLKACIAW